MWDRMWDRKWEKNPLIHKLQIVVKITSKFSVFNLGQPCVHWSCNTSQQITLVIFKRLENLRIWLASSPTLTFQFRLLILTEWPTPHRQQKIKQDLNTSIRSRIPSRIKQLTLKHFATRGISQNKKAHCTNDITSSKLPSNAKLGTFGGFFFFWLTWATPTPRTDLPHLQLPSPFYFLSPALHFCPSTAAFSKSWEKWVSSCCLSVGTV